VPTRSGWRRPHSTNPDLCPVHDLTPGLHQAALSSADMSRSVSRASESPSASSTHGAPITRRHRNSTPGPARKLANAAHGVATVDPRSRVDATGQNAPAAPAANHRRAAAKRLWFAWATHDHQLLDAVRSVQGVGHIVPLSRLRLASPVVLGWVCRPRWWAPRTGRVGADRRPSSTRHPRTRGRSG